ncbi:Mth938-like domain-containing protein [Coxiella endosymbiont of Amblyomma americanum]|uniref:Mth938-like domain-containing protein n=1 Tax=Coxiella endosymbiont of Amblyomma americanum TaxID=325775 RepID=UPI00057E3565|nr:Mth938-like domain-containing protein [Coxiella endosymbiont of Amblyomma americanum]AJC50555.1 membrane protein [Coxiella endosymbiont of Amblyomma americanum]AUJ58889.1 hypothetical protein B1F76_02325 [Coxiella-like endosymbiont of Amblyomma americanum]
MLLTEDFSVGNYHIIAYDAGSVTINKKLYTENVIVSPFGLIENWEPKSLEDIQPEHFCDVLSLNPEVVILGTGKKCVFLSQEKSKLFLHQRIGIECMDTGAACRTYVALVSEGRKTVAALIL